MAEETSRGAAAISPERLRGTPPEPTTFVQVSDWPINDAAGNQIRALNETWRSLYDQITTLDEQIAEAGFVGGEIGADEARLYQGLQDLADEITEQSGDTVTVDDLLSGKKLVLKNVRLGEFEVETRTFRSGAGLLSAILDDDLTAFTTYTNGAVTDVNKLEEMISRLDQSAKNRPDVAAMEQQRNTLIQQASEIDQDANELSAAMGFQPPTGGGKKEPLSLVQQMALLDRLTAKYEEGNDFGVPVPPNRDFILNMARQLAAPEMADIAPGESPEALRAGREATVLPTSSMLREFGGSPELARARASRAAAVGPAAAVAAAGQPVPDGRVGAAGLNPAQAAAMGAADVAERVGDVTAGAKAMKAQEFSRLTAQGISPEEAFNLVFGPDAVTPSTTVPSSGAGGAPRLTAAQIAEANQAEVEALLASQFGGFSFFLQKNRIDMMVGLDANGMVVAADDPNAVSAKNVLDVIVEQGITDPRRVLGILQNTAWWKVTDAQMRQYDVSTANMSEPEKLEYLEPVLQLLEEEAQFLGVQLDASRARRLAENITRMGEQQDPEYIRGTLLAELEYDNTKQSLSEFGAARDQIKALSRSYFVPIDDAAAGVFAEDVYVGRKTTEQVEQYFREQASNRFPTLENAINAGVTPEQYFSPYKYEIERMLDRPNVDLYEEFADVIDFIPDTGVGAGTPRPMTLGEVRKYVRGLDEWQQSSQGKDSARSLAFAIGREFGEVA